MLKASVLLGCILMATVLFACKKGAPYDAAKQMEIDDALIAKFLVDSNLVDSFTKHSTGLYYHIIKSAAGDHSYLNSDFIYANYTTKILRDSVFSEKRIDSTFVFTLPGYIEGWQTGVRLIQPGSKIRLLIPSPLAYQGNMIASPVIPPNSILDITLEILSVNKKPK